MGLYLAGLPSAYYLAVESEYGVHGLWVGYGIGEAVILFCYVLIYNAIDWQVVFAVVQEQQRLKQEELKKLYASQSSLGLELPDPKQQNNDIEDGDEPQT